MAHLWARWLRNPCRLADPLSSKWGTSSDVALLWARWLHHPCRLGIPSASERGTKSEVAQLWARWLRSPCLLGDPLRFKAGDKIISGPLVGKVATSPLPPRGSPPPQVGGQNQKWPTCGQGGYVTPAASGIPAASKRGKKSEVAHLWARWLHYPCRLKDPLRFQKGGQNPEGPSCGQGGYINPAASGISSASKRGAKLEVAHFWARWLHHPCRLGDPLRFKAGDKIRSCPLVGKVATSPLPPHGSPPLQSGSQNQKWPTCGQGGYITPAASGIPSA